MIKLENIKQTFNGKTVLDDFSLEVKEREFVTIMGTSGAGKTTVLNIIGLLSKPDQGTVTIAGYENPNKKQILTLRRQHFGYIFQNYVLLESKTVAENLKISKKYNPDFNNDAVKEALETVGLDSSLLSKKVYQLSGGEQQRIAIARALLKRCDLILADEPTGNLDNDNKRIIIDLFKKLKGMGKTIVCVTHDDEMAQSADRVIRLKHL